MTSAVGHLLDDLEVGVARGRMAELRNRLPNLRQVQSRPQRRRKDPTRPCAWATSTARAYDGLYREAELRSAVDALLVDRAPDRLVLDVCGLQFLDYSGLRALLACRDHAHNAGVPLALAVTPGPVTRLFDAAGVQDWFDYE